MDTEKLRELLEQLQAGKVDVEAALARLRRLPYEDLGHTRMDLHRALRQGLPEVVFCQNKSIEQAIAIVQRLSAHHERVLATRVSAAMAEAITKSVPNTRYDATSRLLTVGRAPLPPSEDDAPYAMLLCAGTSDLPVLEEAAQTLEFLGHRALRAVDVGVAGLHRLAPEQERMAAAGVVICVAGMEGALTSVVAGMIDCPVVGVPTSVGYGASFGGIAALLAMLNCCAPGVAVVNIDNGFGAAVYAHLILKRLAPGRSSFQARGSNAPGEATREDAKRQ